MTGPRLQDPCDRDYHGHAPWERDECFTCGGSGRCEVCDADDDHCALCDGTGECFDCGGGQEQ